MGSARRGGVAWWIRLQVRVRVRVGVVVDAAS